LFQRAIDESGAFGALLKSPTEAMAEATGQAFANKVGCTNQSASCLRSLSVQQILANQQGFTLQPVVDGTLLPSSLDTAFRSGQFNRVPVIDGTNRDELRWSVAFTYDLAGAPLTAAQYQSYITATYRQNAALVSAKYPLSNFPSPDVALATLQTDAGVACSARVTDQWLSRYTPTYAYEFADRNAPTYLPPVSFPVGAGHTTEIQFLFPLYHGGQGIVHPLSPAEQVLSDRMVSYWTRFAWSGNPNSTATPFWPRYDPGTDIFQFLLAPDPLPSADFAAEHNCGFWNELLNLTTTH
jgi:para-nitrobenzyl esterase